MPDHRQTLSVRLSQKDTYLFESWGEGLHCWRRDEAENVRAACFPFPMIARDHPDNLDDRIIGLFEVANRLLDRDIEGDRLIPELIPWRDWLRDIPLRERRLASQCGNRHYLALEAMRHVPGFTEFLEQEINGAGLNFVVAVWGLGKAMEQPKIFRLELAQRTMGMPRVQVLEMLTDQPCSNALLHLIEKIPPDDLNADIMWMAVDAMARPAMKQALGELQAITAEALTELMKLPDWLIMPALVRVLVNAFHGGHTLESIIPPSLLTAPKEVHERLRESLSGARDLAALEKRIYQWADRLYYEVSFPPPPVKGNAILQPLLTGLMLRQEGRKMQNCVAGYAEEVLDGESYFYAWRGKIRATLQLNHTQENRWVLTEALGVENNELPPDERVSIVEALAESFGDEGLFLFRCSIAGSGYYELAKALPDLTKNTDLCLLREPGNSHDTNAIEVLTKNGLKLGYVPHSKNEDVARWMDDGLAVCVRFISNRGCLIELVVRARGGLYSSRCRVPGLASRTPRVDEG